MVNYQVVINISGEITNIHNMPNIVCYLFRTNDITVTLIGVKIALGRINI